MQKSCLLGLALTVIVLFCDSKGEIYCRRISILLPYIRAPPLHTPFLLLFPYGINLQRVTLRRVFIAPKILLANSLGGPVYVFNVSDRRSDAIQHFCLFPSQWKSRFKSERIEDAKFIVNKWMSRSWQIIAYKIICIIFRPKLTYKHVQFYEKSIRVNRRLIFKTNSDIST